MPPNIQTAFLFEGFNRADYCFNTQFGEIRNVLKDKVASFFISGYSSFLRISSFKGTRSLFTIAHIIEESTAS